VRDSVDEGQRESSSKREDADEDKEFRLECRA
jgi:hypothetical protein